jgi:hypothetical protein
MVWKVKRFIFLMSKTTTKSKNVEDGTFKGSKGTIYHLKFLPFSPLLCDHQKISRIFMHH